MRALSARRLEGPLSDLDSQSTSQEDAAEEAAAPALPAAPRAPAPPAPDDADLLQYPASRAPYWAPVPPAGEPCHSVPSSLIASEAKCSAPAFGGRSSSCT